MSEQNNMIEKLTDRMLELVEKILQMLDLSTMNNTSYYRTKEKNFQKMNYLA